MFPSLTKPARPLASAFSAGRTQAKARITRAVGVPQAVPSKSQGWIA